MEPPADAGTSYFRPQRPQASKTTSPGGRFTALLATSVAAALPLAFIFLSIHVGHGRRSVYVVQVCSVIGLLQKSWWHYRIRQRFLAPLEASIAALFGSTWDPETPRPDSAQYESMLRERMEPKDYAISRFTRRWMTNVCGATVLATLLAALAASTVATAVALACEASVAVCAAVGSFTGVVSACLAPTPSDGVAIIIHQGALTVTAMNTMIAHYTGSGTSLHILDYLFVALAGWIIIVISRIVASKKLLECFLMVMLDTVALLHVTVIMMELVDFVEHPVANKLPEELAAFFITIASAEGGHYLFELVVTEYIIPRRWSTRKRNAIDFTVSVLFGAIGTVAWMFCYRTTTMGAWHVIALLVAAVLSQLGRSFITLIHETAMTPSWSLKNVTVWNNGIMELMNPFLVGWIVFHPYAKTTLEAEGGY